MAIKINDFTVNKTPTKPRKCRMYKVNWCTEMLLFEENFIQSPKTEI